jgi:hypothetical protein
MGRGCSLEHIFGLADLAHLGAWAGRMRKSGGLSPGAVKRTGAIATEGSQQVTGRDGCVNPLPDRRPAARLSGPPAFARRRDLRGQMTCTARQASSAILHVRRRMCGRLGACAAVGGKV